METLMSLARAAGHEPMPVPATRSLENPKTPLYAACEDGWVGGGRIGPMTALQSTALWACIRILAGTVAKLPIITYSYGDGRIERAENHYLYPLLHDQPNEAMTAYRFKHLMQLWLLLWGNAYAAIEISGRGQVTALYPMRPDRVRVRPEGGAIYYEYWGRDQKPLTLHQDFVLHLRWMSFDGIVGLSPIEAHRRTIGTDLSQAEQAGKFYSNGMRLSGVLKFPGTLGDKAFANIKESLRSEYSGSAAAWKTLILENGGDFTPMQVKPADAEYVATKKLGVADIARIYGVPLHKLAELDRATFSNIEHQALEFVTDSIDEHLTNWEQELASSLLSPQERKRIYPEFLLDKLLRGDTKSRYEAYSTAIRGGFLTINEARGFDNRNPVAGGDRARVQMQMVPLDAPPPAPAKGAA